MKALFALALAAAPVFAPPAPAQMVPAYAQTAPVTAPDYTRADNWLCRPGRADACSANQDTTVIRASGDRDIEKFSPASAAKFDCFYVYPTVSLDRAPNSDMIAGPEEQEVAAFQAARFTRHCRVFAPLYRQVTITALQALLQGKPVMADRVMAYEDVKAAWEEYLRYDNHGRGIVLIGHSQGSGILKALVANAIEGTPVQRQIISVMIPGTNVAVPVGKDVGGDLKSTPTCHASNQTGCLVSYVTFRADAPPPGNSRFGVVPQAGMTAACVNPAALGDRGGKPGPVASDAYLGAHSAGMASAPMGPWTRDGKPVATSFVRVPGLISTQCVANGKASYLAVTVNADPADPRTDTIVGDIVIGGTPLKDWGLHLIDMAVVMGDLVELSDDQARAWLAKQ